MAPTQAAETAHPEMAGLPRVVWVLAGGSFINNFGSFVVPFLMLYLLHRGYSAELAAGAVSAYAAGKIAAGPAGGCSPTGSARGLSRRGRWPAQPQPPWLWPQRGGRP